jgi:hypothetical protein
MPNVPVSSATLFLISGGKLWSSQVSANLSKKSFFIFISNYSNPDKPVVAQRPPARRSYGSERDPAREVVAKRKSRFIGELTIEYLRDDRSILKTKRSVNGKRKASMLQHKENLSSNKQIWYHRRYRFFCPSARLAGCGKK